MATSIAPEQPEAGAMVGVVIGVVVVVVGFVILTPFATALDRVRANYTPRAVSLDGGEDAFVGPRLTGVFSTLKRVMQLEGWFGVFRGFYAIILTGLISGLINSLTNGLTTKLLPQTTPGGIIGTAVINLCVGLVVSLPLMILVNRAIVTPYRTPSTPLGALRTLLTPYERSRPWILFRIAGLLPAVAVLQLAAAGVAALTGFGVLDVLGDGKKGKANKDKKNSITAARIAVVFVVYALSTLWCVPLKVVIMKISIQANHEYQLTADPDADAEGETDALVSGANGGRAQLHPLRVSKEPVVALRPGQHYRGMLDAVRTIAAEEGRAALFRCWEWTLLGNMLVAATLVTMAVVVQSLPQGAIPEEPMRMAARAVHARSVM